MRKKKKGYTLMLSIGVSIIVLTLFTIIFSLAVASFLTTANVKQNNKLKLIAESGVQRGETLLRNYILHHPDYLENSSSFNPYSLNTDASISGNLTFTTPEGVTCHVRFSPDTSPSSGESPSVYDTVTGRDVDYIGITATATDTIGRTKTVEEDIDKNGVFNVYFDRLFKGCLTTLDKVSDGNDSFNMSGHVNLTASGSMYLQGGNVNLFPQSGFTMDEGSILFKGGTLNTNVKDVTPAGVTQTIQLYKDDNPRIPIPDSKWEDAQINEIPIQNIIEKSSTNLADDMQDLTAAIQPDVSDSYVFFKMPPVAGTDYKTTLATYKAKGGATPIDFGKLINGTAYDYSYGIYRQIINKLKNDPYGYSEEDANNNYGKMYKLILIDGNLNIEDRSYITYNNYIIYCTGTVTFEGDAKFYNSSIVAKQISFNSSCDHSIIFNGVNTSDSVMHTVGSSKLADFTQDDKAIINEYLINNVENYADYIKFKTIKLTEK